MEEDTNWLPLKSCTSSRFLNLKVPTASKCILTPLPLHKSWPVGLVAICIRCFKSAQKGLCYNGLNKRWRKHSGYTSTRTQLTVERSACNRLQKLYTTINRRNLLVALHLHTRHTTVRIYIYIQQHDSTFTAVLSYVHVHVDGNAEIINNRVVD